KEGGDSSLPGWQWRISSHDPRVPTFPARSAPSQTAGLDQVRCEAGGLIHRVERGSFGADQEFWKGRAGILVYRQPCESNSGRSRLRANGQLERWWLRRRGRLRARELVQPEPVRRGVRLAG